MECEICFNPWNNDIRIPKILPCGHTFCQSCIKEALNKSTLQQNNFKCPSCKSEINSLIEFKDILELPNNNGILTLIGKMETQKIKTNTSNSMSISLQNNNISNTNNKINNNNQQKDENPILNLKNNYQSKLYINKKNDQFFPICQIHKSKANFYIIKNDNIIFICNDCLQLNQYKNIFPLPYLKLQNEYKIHSCKNKTKILLEEIGRIENFLNSYQDKFEIENKKKIKELFDYIKNIVRYNITTAKTLFNQCKNEQKIQIDKKMKELSFLRKELSLFDQKLDELLCLNQINPLPESQIELDNVYNKLGNYINYENELNLFTMNITIKDEIKNSLFDLIQNSYKLDIDFLKMKNGELPTIKDLLNKSTKWVCNCGNLNNQIGTIVCDLCTKYRPIETYSNIIFNPMLISKTEKKEFKLRRKHEWKVYQTLIKKNIHINNETREFFFAIDSSWYKRWKCFITNDLKEKNLSNNEKYISENINIGVLPPGPINNINICGDIKEDGIYNLKLGLNIKEDYIVVNQLLWEWFLHNYNGGPEILVENSNLSSSSFFILQENEPKHLKKEEYFENIINTWINNLNNEIKNKKKIKNNNIEDE